MRTGQGELANRRRFKGALSQSAIRITGVRQFRDAHFRCNKRRPASSMQPKNQSSNFRSRCRNTSFSTDWNQALSEKQMPRFVGIVVVRSSRESRWSRVLCAQGRRSNQLSYATNRLSDDFHVLPVLLRGLPGPSGHRTASRHSPIDSSRSAFTRRVLTP